jgi:hypothetical protein
MPVPVISSIRTRRREDRQQSVRDLDHPDVQGELPDQGL